MSLSILKKLGVITVVLLALWIFYMYRQVPHHAFPFEKAADKAQTVVLEKGPKKVSLHPQGSAWKVSGADGVLYAAEENQPKTLVNSLKEVQVEDEISDRPDRAADYDVDAANGTRVTLLDAKGAKLAEGLFGKQAPDFIHIY